jgi:hypothetical protein
MTVFRGPYQEYLAKREEENRAAAMTVMGGASNRRTQDKPRSEPRNGLSSYQRAKRLAELEAEIHDLEAQLDSLSSQLEIASAAGAVDDVAQLGHLYNETETALDLKMGEWAGLA